MAAEEKEIGYIPCQKVTCLFVNRGLQNIPANKLLVGDKKRWQLEVNEEQLNTLNQILEQE
ncbi:hypothetical protein COT75_02635 [Candidatus Beckwithbacteria bacterium CG10_big_fil_rev_8_21_14_0_10_34_10]|uniref:Uncharacterized protein n=1 Tax=Candidatus Beckwithbacteria bacterium CG10_big_fil_rev_8_21_14_0_10_34_10 TaxID=1974495 RepID=A0A2H0WBF8_9BACT|nr:MAG: hypothetical protein COT75_02635 [Candidatus Beckwithbacteria bacterium CG10_big_fil_rev_8_21_14_0_10_34_10]